MGRKEEEMRYLRFAVSTLCLVMLMVFAIPSAKADVADRDTFLTFSAPVEVPGMCLLPGKYEFRIADTGRPANVVEILNSKGHLLEIVEVAADYRTVTTDKTKVTLERRAPGQLESIKSWFYPGLNYGVEFVYPKLSAASAENRR